MACKDFGIFDREKMYCANFHCVFFIIISL